MYQPLMQSCRRETLAWTFERADGGRSFGFTGGHWYGNWLDLAETPFADEQRRLVTNAILWIAHHDVPVDGAPVVVDENDAGQYITPR